MVSLVGLVRPGFSFTPAGPLFYRKKNLVGGSLWLCFILVFLFLLSVSGLAQIAPICDATCTPDPSGSSYAGAAAARPKMLNARGHSSALVATANVNAGATNTVTVIGSQSYGYTVPIVNLAGRAGLDLALNLYYNSRIWDVDTVDGLITFNADRDFPSYGFRLDFGYLENIVGGGFRPAARECSLGAGRSFIRAGEHNQR